MKTHRFHPRQTGDGMPRRPITVTVRQFVSGDQGMVNTLGSVTVDVHYQLTYLTSFHCCSQSVLSQSPKHVPYVLIAGKRFLLHWEEHFNAESSFFRLSDEVTLHGNIHVPRACSCCGQHMTLQSWVDGNALAEENEKA